MAITKTGVLLLAPEFSSVSDPDFTSFIALAAAQVNVSQWAKLADHAGNLLVAHMLTVSRPLLAAGDVVASERVGDVSRAYVSGVMIPKQSLETTRYGREYLRLRAQRSLSPQVA